MMISVSSTDSELLEVSRSLAAGAILEEVCDLARALANSGSILENSGLGTTADIASGALQPFACPVLDQAGKDRCKAGAKTLEDGDILGMNWYVKGIDDKVPQ